MCLQPSASVCASEKGKPVVRRGRKAYGPPSWEEVAGLPNSSDGATKLRPHKGERLRMRPYIKHRHTRLVFHPSSGLFDAHAWERGAVHELILR